MKSFFSILIATFTITGLKALFASTSWKGLYKIPDLREMILQFKSDTLLLADPQNHVPSSMMSVLIVPLPLLMNRLKKWKIQSVINNSLFF